MIHKRSRQLLSIGVLLAISCAIAWYLKSNPDLLRLLVDISFIQACWLMILRVLFMTMNGLFLKAFAGKFGVRLKAIEWFGLAVVTTMGNYITPFSGGLVVRAAYLKNRHGFPYAQFASLLASNYLVAYWVIGVVGTLALLTFGKALRFYWQVFVFFVAVVVSISALVLSPSVRLPWKNRVAKVVNTSLEGWGVVKSDWPLLARLVAYTLVNMLLNGVSFWVAYDALGSPVSFRPALLIGLLASFSILTNVTPGNLGIQEAVVSLSSGLLGTGTGQGLLVALLLRAVTLVWVFTLGPVFSYLLAQNLNESGVSR